MQNAKILECKICVLTSADAKEFQLDEHGVCNFCNQHLQKAREESLNKKQSIAELVAQIKLKGKNKKYDCVLGVSGGCDSTYLAYKAKELGLRALVVHYDNGWNTELAVHNIQNVVQKLGFDLYTYVNDWNEFKDLQLSFLKASVIDIELITDHGILAALYKVAKQHGIKYILIGNNHATESILPASWYHWKNDALNIKAIHRRFGTVKIKTFPYINFYNRLLIDVFKRTHFVSLLDYMDYHKEEAKKLLSEQLGWRDYGGKHFESVFTRFYQGYILPKKFNVNKRKAHLSSLILSGQITREQALKMLETTDYPEEQQQEDKAYVIKKFDLTPEAFEAIMQAPIRDHMEFPSYITRHYKYFGFISKLWRFFKKQ